MTETQSADSPLPQPNLLSYFTSFNYVFTLSCLSNEQINFPESTYKAGDFGLIICRSGSGDPNNRVSTAYTSHYNPEGKFEYYFDSLDFNAVISYDKATGGTNATTFNFEIIEPYSMGIFLQSVQLAAFEAGHPNYIEAPYLLTIEFTGYVETAPLAMTPATRHLPIKFTKMDMDVTTSGTRYKVEATAWNEQALNDTNGLMKSDISIAGKTVQEILQTGPQSLQTAINNSLKTVTEKETTKAVPSQVLILFPNDLSTALANTSDKEIDSSATVDADKQPSNGIESRLKVSSANSGLFTQAATDLNEIGKSKMGFDMTSGGETALAADNFVYDDKIKRYKRGSLLFDKNSRSFMFAQGTSIVNAITEVLLLSEFCKNAAIGNKLESAGMKTWFRIETQVYNLEPKEGNKGKATTPRILVYRVVPYKVHSSRFISPTSPAAGFEELKKQAAKEYNYLYTGKNTEILDFNINLEAGFFTAATADLGLNTKDIATAGRSSAGKAEVKELIPNSNNLGQGSEAGLGTQQQGSTTKVNTTSGGGPTDDAKSMVARVFQNTLLNSDADMLTVDLTIQGDPYFIADSGMGNFSDSGSGSMNITESGAIDYQTGEVDIVLNFRTPIDIDPIFGTADFGNSNLVEGFSGLYQVMTLDNQFKDGKFTQTLNLVRRPKQFVAVNATNKGTNSNGSSKTSEDTGGSATANPNVPNNSSKTTTVSSRKTSENQYGDAPPENTYYPDP
jgi:hypothetical protein